MLYAKCQAMKNLVLFSFHAVSGIKTNDFVLKMQTLPLGLNQYLNIFGFDDNLLLLSNKGLFGHMTACMLYFRKLSENFSPH